jgi:hypothetical protein
LDEVTINDDQLALFSVTTAFAEKQLTESIIKIKTKKAAFNDTKGEAHG